MKIGSHEIDLSNTDKVFFPDADLTKGDLIDYYRRVAPTMLPHLRGRPLTLHRFPDGLGGEGFIQKNASDYFPDWIERVSVKKREGGTVEHVVCETAETLVYLANQACITPHVWLSRTDRLRYPDRMIFDLDPPDEEFDLVRQAALALGDVLESLGLRPWAMTTGSRGLHVVVAVDRRADFDAVRAFAHDLADLTARRHPDTLTTEQRKDKRRGRLFLDTGRNAYAQTGVAPYAVRAKPGAPVATPLAWTELRDNALGPRKYTIHNLFRRLGQKTDPWRAINNRPASLAAARKRLDRWLAGKSRAPKD